MSRFSRPSILACLVAAAVCFAVSPRPNAAQSVPQNPGQRGPHNPAQDADRNAMAVERLVATAVSTDPDGAAAGRIDLTIERWSTDDERETLRRALADDNPATLVDALGKVFHRVGVVQMPGQIGAGARARTRRARILKFAREIKTATGRQIVLAADQNIGLGEDPKNFRSNQPEFTLIDIRLGPDGKGEGKVASAKNVSYNKTTQTIEITNYASEPVRLRNVSATKPSR